MNLTKNEISLLRKPPAKFVGRDKRAAEELVAKGAMRSDGKGGYFMTKAGADALAASAPKKDK